MKNVLMNNVLMKKRAIYVCLMMIFGILITACDNNKGNYEYDSLKTEYVDKASLPTSIVVKQNEIFDLKPVYNDATNPRLKYQWRLMTTSMVVDPETGKFYDEIVGTDKDLNLKVTANPGDYVLILTVSDAAHGDVTQLIKTPFVVSSYASIGWMLMHNDADSSDVSIIVNPLVNSQITAQTDYVQRNVFSETNGHKIAGAAKGANYFINHWVELYTDTDEGGVRTSGNDLRVIEGYRDMFLEPLAKADVEFNAVGSWSYNQMLINKGDIYLTSHINGVVHTKYGVKAFGEDYVAAPFIGTQVNASYFGVIYDTKKKRFLYIGRDRGMKTFKAAGPTAGFDMSNVGLDMIYAEHGIESKWFCMMKNPANPLFRQLLACRFNVADDGNRGVGKYDLSAATDIQAAKYYAFGHKANVMYYATDDKLYQNNYEGDRTSVLRLDIATTYPGYKVSAMQLFKVTNHPSDGKLLYIAIYNNATKEGKLIQCQVNEVTGIIAGSKVYDGFGRIGGMSYKAK